MTFGRDGSGGAGRRRGIAAGFLLSLALVAGAASGGDNAAYVSSSNVPLTMTQGGQATVTVTMRNTGTTTWTTALGYKLGSQSPADNTTWGTNRVSLASDTAPGAEAVFTVAITAPSTKGGHVFAWRMVRDPGGERYDIFEEVDGGLDYRGTFEGGSGGGQAGPSVALDRPFRWMNRFMAVGDAVESRVTGRLLSDRRRNQDGGLLATMRIEVLSHRASFEIPAVEGLIFEDVLEVRYWPDAARVEVHDTFYLARGYGRGVRAAVRGRGAGRGRRVVGGREGPDAGRARRAVGPVVRSVLSGLAEDRGAEREPGRCRARSRTRGHTVRDLRGAGWTAASGSASVAPPPSGLDAGALSLVLRGRDAAPAAAVAEEWIPVEGGTYRLSACMMRENARDNVFVDFDDGTGRDAVFDDAHLVASSTGKWECRAVTKCIPASVGAVRVRAARNGANLGDARFDRIDLKRIAACAGGQSVSRP